MSKSSTIILIAVATLAALALLVVAGAALLLSFNAKPRFEAIASEFLAMDVKVDGHVTIGFLPRLHYALSDVRVHNHGLDVASVDEVDLAVGMLGLLRRQVQIERLGLKRLRISIDRGRDGKLNVDRLAEVPGTLPVLAVNRVTASDASFRYTDKQNGAALEAEDCDLNVSRLQISSEGGRDVLRAASIAATLACKQVRSAGFTASGLNLSVDGKSGLFDIDPLTMRLLGGHGSGTLRVDVSGPVPLFHLRYRLNQFQMEEFFKTLSPKSVGRGAMNFSATLSMRGTTRDNLVGCNS